MFFHNIMFFMFFFLNSISMQFQGNFHLFYIIIYLTFYIMNVYVFLLHVFLKEKYCQKFWTIIWY